MQVIYILQGQTAATDRVRSFLIQTNYAIRVFQSIADLFAEAQKRPPALVFVETGSKNLRNLEYYKTVRRYPLVASVPTIAFSGESTDEVRIRALENGADDCICGPFSRRELVARMQAVLRNAGPVHSDGYQAQSDAVEANSPDLNRAVDFHIDAPAMKIFVRGREIATTTLEFRLLNYLAKNEYRVFSRDQLLDAVWENQYVTTRSVDACIRRIRRKLESDQSNPAYLKTVRGAGYILDLSAASRTYAATSKTKLSSVANAS